MKPSSSSTVEQKLTGARTQLLLNRPFFGTLCLRLQLVPGLRPTLATDGSRIVYNPAFVDSLSPAELEGSLAHEVPHCALGHHCRRGGRDSTLWNHAADYAINPILVKNGLTLPAGVLIDPQYESFGGRDLCAAEEGWQLGKHIQSNSWSGIRQWFLSMPIANLSRYTFTATERTGSRWEP